MDIGIIFNHCVTLYRVLWSASFTIFGMSFTYGQIISYGLFLTVVIAFVNFLRE